MNKDLIEFYEEEKNRIQKEIDDLWEVGKKSPKRVNRLVEIEYILDGLEADKKIRQLNEENQELKKQLEERKYYKFYKYENNPCGSDYCFCERPCDSNMNLKCFFENGEICGFMSETLVSNHDNIEEISLNEFAHNFIKPLINANFQNKNQQKELMKYLEDEIHSCEAVSDLLFNSNKEMKVYKEILQKYKKIIGISDEK